MGILDKMKYAEVAVDAPVDHSRTFSYSIPPKFTVVPGQLVWVPFGRRIAQGVVVELANSPQVEVAKDLLQPIEPAPLVSPVHIKLAKWLSRYYLCSLFAAIASLLPPGFERHVKSQVYLDSLDNVDSLSLRPQTLEALTALTGRSGLREEDLVKLLGRNGGWELSRLLQKGLVRRHVELPQPRIVPRYQSYLLLASVHDDASGESGSDRLSQRQRELLQEVGKQRAPYLSSVANKKFGNSAAEALFKKGLLGREWVRVEPNPPPVPCEIEVEPRLSLTGEQAAAVARITDVVDHPEQTPRLFLLHGLTGSGKTEVYLRAIQHLVARGEQAIFLVPEIALTPQTQQRVNDRFPGRVAVLHSGLTPRQKFDQWWKIREGHYDVVVGPRSSLFAPVPRLGLIIIDEEHEWTYKQEESPPLYHARAVALELSRLTGAPVVLGSATPDVETYYHARRGRYQLMELTRRIGEPDDSSGRGLADVQICDMRNELREGNRSIFSRQLSQALQDCISRGQQAILFLNRRGSAPIVQCRDCGYVATCSSCSAAQTYHATHGQLLCHRCNRRSRMPSRCRRCGGNKIRGLGIGTQKVVEAVSALLPGVRVARWDADATRAGLSAEDAMSRLQSGETQILVGTQLVAKGLDVPNVALVGVILADVGLYLPDFRSGERAFGLLCQVAGRAGRGASPGKVLVQTYTPDHYAIVAAAAQDYSAMFQREIKFRHQLGNPPFNQLVHFVYQDVNPTLCQRHAVSAARELRQLAYSQGLTDVEVVGPAPGVPSRTRGRYRWHVILRGRNLHQFLERSNIPRGSTVDVDPVHVL